MNGPMVEIWERVLFRGQEPVTWERSFDNGKTWQMVAWPFWRLPFVQVHPSWVHEFETITITQRNPEEVKLLTEGLQQ